MNNSNRAIRNRVILKALVFTIIPMLFFGWGGYLIGSMQGEIDKDNIDKFKAMETEFEAFKIEEELFLTAMNNLNNDWESHFNTHQKFILNNDSSSIEKLEINIEERGKNLLSNIQTSKGKIKETNYLTALVSFENNFDDYLIATKNSRNFKKKLTTKEIGGECCKNLLTIELEKEDWERKFRRCDGDLINCKGSSNLDEKLIRICETQKQELENDKRQLERNKRELEGKIREKETDLANLTTTLEIKHRKQLLDALSSSNVNDNKKTKILKSVPFGKGLSNDKD